MKKSWIPRAAFLALLITTTTALAFADIPNPDSGNRRNASKSDLATQLQIQTDEKAKEARLVIPREIFQQMRAQADGTNSQNAASTARFFNMTGERTIASGIFLSLAFATAGLWLVRSRKAAGKLPRAVSVGLALLLACGLTAGIVYANAGPPAVARSLTSNILIPELQWWGAYGQVKVEIVEEGNEIKLVLPKTKIKESDRRETE